MNIRLTSDVPFFSRPRKSSHAEKLEIREIVKELLDTGIIQPSESPYASRIVPVKKSVDYKTLNKVTVRDNHPLPLIDDCLEYLSNKKFFSLLDLKSGFHQVRVSESSRKYTAFVTSEGQYEYKYMPFGLKNGPSVFQRFINKILKKFLDSGRIVIYMDDIMLATKTLDEHLELLSEVRHCITVNGLKLQLLKCKFAYTTMEYLGFVISKDGILPGIGKTKAILQFPMPSDIRSVHSFLGMCQFFKRFIPGFARIANPLYKLLHKDVVFNFSEKCIESFNELKKALTSAPVLAIYDPTKETELHTDASSIGFGAVLLQKQQDSKLHPVAYFSKSVSKYEANYHSYELETLAIVYALDRFHVYLSGIPFTIVTDCNSLVLTFNKRDVNSRIARWVWEFERYNYKIKHRSGSLMNHVDTLSRYPIVATIDALDLDFQLRVTQNRDPVISKLKDTLEISESPPYELHDGVVYRRNKNNRMLFYVPCEMEQQLIQFTHEKIGHFGSDKCCDQMRLHYWFPCIKEKVDSYMKNCIKFILHSAPQRPSEHSLYSIPKKPLPFDTLHIDHFGPLPSVTSKQKHLLVVVDAFTKFVKLYPATSTSTKEVCRALEKYIEFYSQRGTCFTSSEFSDFIELNNIQHIKNSVASPQANGQVERINRILKNMLGKLTEPLQHSDWTKQLKHVEYAINNTVQRSTGTSPSKLLFGVNQKGPQVDYLSEFIDDKDESPSDRNLETIREIASANISKSQKYSQKWCDEHCNPAKVYEIGDFVVARYVDTSAGNKKFTQSFRGPYIVHKILPNDRYVIRDIENCQITQLPYDGVIEAKHLKLWKRNSDASQLNVTLPMVSS